MRKRKRLKFVPQFEGPIEAWTKKYIAKNKWKVPSYLEFEDLLSEGFAKFLLCCESYPEVSEPAHFMRLYQSCVYNMFTDFSYFKSLEYTIPVGTGPNGTDITIEDLVNKHHGYNHNAGPLCVMIKEAPQEVRELLETLFDEAKLEFLRKPFARKVGRKGLAVRETTNERLNALIGTEDKDLVAELINAIGQD